MTFPTRTDEAVYGICLHCGRSHSASNRRRLLKPMVELEFVELRELWPCFYPPGKAGERLLQRDRAALRRAA